MVWCTLAVGFAYKILMSLTGLYFEGEEAGERSLVICMGFAYLFLSMMILIVDENTLETGLDEAYTSFNESAANFLAENAGLESSGPASKLVLKFFIALWCGSIGKENKNVFSNHQITLRSIFKNLVKWQQDFEKSRKMATRF